MPPAPTTFVQLCRANNIAAVPANQRLQFLRDAATLASEGLSAKSLTERCAALSWARDSLQNSTDPDTWPTLLTPALYAYLQGLYTVPPYKGAPPTPSNERRLADIITLFTPADGAANAANAQQQQPPQDGININRQDGNANNAAPPPPPPPQTKTSTNIGAPHPSPSGGKRKWLMHDELVNDLPPEVYQVLDLSSGMPYRARIKLQDSCKRGDMASLLDRTIAAAFSHQVLLSLADGAHFDSPKRGLALAGAGRSATAAGASGQTLSDMVARDAHLRTLREQWTTALPAFAADTELSGSIVNNLWGGVHFIMTIRAARSSSWGVQEVEDACNSQLASLPAYRSAVASVISRVATAYSGVEVPRSVNRAYLQFFLPFWWEHILERGRLDDAAAEKQAALLLKPETPPVPALPAPALLAPTPPAAPHPWPYPPAPFFHYPLPTPPPPYIPPGPTPGRPAARGAAPPPSPNRATPQQPFVGKPVSALIVGNNFGVETPVADKNCACAVTRQYPSRGHRSFECPLRYWTLRGSCPGWTASGDRVPAAWNGDDITAACQAEWKHFAGSLPRARTATGPDTVF